MRRLALVCGGLACAAMLAAPSAGVASSPTLPLAVRAAAWSTHGGRLIGRATIFNSTRSSVRPTRGYLSVRPTTGGDLTGVAGFSLPSLPGRSSKTIDFAGPFNPGALLLRPARYSVLVCLDVDSQLARFAAARNCRLVGHFTLVASRPGPGTAPPDTIISAAPGAVATNAAATFAFRSTEAASRFQCRLDGGPWVQCRSPLRYTELADGPHAFDVRAINHANVADPTPGHASWVSAMLAATPYMGWNTYYGVGGIFDEQTILSVASALIDRGLARAGYRIVWLDFGWASGARDSAGNLIVDRRQWPHGLAWLTAWLHSHGLLAGIYTDAGASGCDHQGVGSLGHYQQDADAFAAWGFDAVKVDFCGAGQEGLHPEPLYAEFAAALAHNSSDRPVLLNVCNFWVPGQIDGTRPSLTDSSYENYRWAPAFAQSWRTDTDIGFTHDVKFVNVLRNLDHDGAHPAAAGPGHWNDPDYLGPELGMSAAQAQAQLTMWAIVAAPLILGSDPRSLSARTIAMLANREVIAIDQDPLGVQGRVIATHGSGQVWARPLAGGAKAVALLNRGSTPDRILTTARALGLPPARSYTVYDAWRHTSHRTAGAIEAVVAPGSAVLYRVAG